MSAMRTSAESSGARAAARLQRIGRAGSLTAELRDARQEPVRRDAHVRVSADGDREQWLEVPTLGQRGRVRFEARILVEVGVRRERADERLAPHRASPKRSSAMRAKQRARRAPSGPSAFAVTAFDARDRRSSRGARSSGAIRRSA